MCVGGGGVDADAGVYCCMYVAFSGRGFFIADVFVDFGLRYLSSYINTFGDGGL
jgi:hypothetical protein